MAFDYTLAPGIVLTDEDRLDARCKRIEPVGHYVSHDDGFAGIVRRADQVDAGIRQHDTRIFTVGSAPIAGSPQPPFACDKGIAAQTDRLADELRLASG